MQTYSFSSKIKQTILALGAESDGNFCACCPNPLPLFKGEMSEGQRGSSVYFSESFGDLLEESNWQKFRSAVLKFLRENKIRPEIILSDLHPDFQTTIFAKNLAKKYNAQYFSVQHHIAHVFSAIGEKIILNTKHPISHTIYGIAMDGTGFGADEKIWGGEVFEISFLSPLFKGGIKGGLEIKRIGRLENQTLLGGELAIQEPARMLLGILNKFLPKNKIHPFLKKHYSPNQFELLYNQLQQNFNCLETSSTGRVLDAVSLLLGFCQNERKYKHEPIDLLEKNSTQAYADLKPRIVLKNSFSPFEKGGAPTSRGGGFFILETTPLFEYLIKNIDKDKRRLSATAQFYLAKGFYEIIKKNNKNPTIFCAGGMANNKIISNYLESKNVFMNQKFPRGDGGISFGQIFYYLLKN